MIHLDQALERGIQDQDASSGARWNRSASQVTNWQRSKNLSKDHGIRYWTCSTTGSWWERRQNMVWSQIKWIIKYVQYHQFLRKKYKEILMAIHFAILVMALWSSLWLVIWSWRHDQSSCQQKGDAKSGAIGLFHINPAQLVARSLRNGVR